MHHLVTSSELEKLTEMELRSVFNRIANKLAFNQQLIFEYFLLLASLENIKMEMHRRRICAPEI